MPKIPIFEQSQTILPDAPPGADLSYGTPAADAALQFGSQLNQIGFQVAMKRKEAEDKNYAYTKAMQNNIKIEEFKEELKKTSPPDYRGYSDKVKDFAETLFKEGEEQAPSETAKNMYSMQFRQDAERAILSANAFQNHEATIYRRAEVLKSGDLINKRIAQGADDKWALKSLQTFEKATNDLVGTDYSAQEGALIIQKNKEAFSNAHYDYLLSLDRPAARAKAIKELKTEKHPFNQGLDADKLGAWLIKFKNQEIGANKFNLQMFQQLKDIMKNGSSAGLVDQKQADQAIAASDSAYANNPTAKLDSALSTLVEQRVSDTMKSGNPQSYAEDVAGATNSIIDKLTEHYRDDPTIQGHLKQPGFKEKVKNDLTDRFKKVLKDRESNLTKDPVATLLGNQEVSDTMKRFKDQAKITDPYEGIPHPMQESVPYLREQQLKSGVPIDSVRAITKADSAALKEKLLSAQSRASVIDQIQYDYGTESTAVFKDIYKDHKELGNLPLVGLIDDSSTREVLLAAVSKEGQEAILADTQKRPNVVGITMKQQFNAAFSRQMSQAIRDASGSPLQELTSTAGFGKLVWDYANHLLATKTVGDGSVAIRKAYNDVIKNEFSAIPTNDGHFVLYKIRQPSSFEKDSEFLGRDITEKFLRDSGVEEPFIKDVLKTGYWATNAQMTGAILKYTDYNGKPKVVPALKDKAIVPVEYRFYR